MTRTLLGASALLALFLARPATASDPDDRPLPIPHFKLTERSGETITEADLRGKVWVASFLLTNCPDGKCFQVAATLAELQKAMADRKDFRIVTFAVDPAPDEDATRKKIEALRKLAEGYAARPDRWLFLTGDDDQIDRIMRELYLRPRDRKVDPHDHSQRLVLVDRDGNVDQGVGRDGKLRAYFDGMRESKVTPADFDRNLLRLRRAADKALQPRLPAWMPRDFPAFNAALNALASVLIVLGYVAIRQRMVRLHVAALLSAIAVSALFLASYLFFHIVVKEWRPTRFVDQAPDAPAWVAGVYAAVLLSHTALAIVATPMALIAAYLGLRSRLSAHTKLARWALPIWLYVSVTGVVVYWMLYRLYPAP